MISEETLIKATIAYQAIRKALAISEKTAACKHDSTVCSNALATLNQLEEKLNKENKYIPSASHADECLERCNDMKNKRK